MVLKTAFYGGAGAAFASLAAIMILSRLEGQKAVRPVNATSHVLWGHRAGSSGKVDVRHTLPGFLINVVSAFFWGAVFACALPRTTDNSTGRIVGRAMLTSLVAAILDYAIVPRRLRPGWELALKARSVALALAAMGFGLAGGGFAASRNNRS